jgi:hypothetical protein
MPDASSSNLKRQPALVFNSEDKTDNRIVNNLECGYHLKNHRQSKRNRGRKAWTATAQGEMA